MIMQHSLTWELMLYKFKLGYITADVTKNSYCIKGGIILNHDTINGGLKKFSLRATHLICLFGKSSEQHSESIRQTCYFTVQYGSSPSQPQQKRLELMNCVVHYQNIAKLLSHLSIWYKRKMNSPSILVCKLVLQISND